MMMTDTAWNVIYPECPFEMPMCLSGNISRQLGRLRFSPACLVRREAWDMNGEDRMFRHRQVRGAARVLDRRADGCGASRCAMSKLSGSTTFLRTGRRVYIDTIYSYGLVKRCLEGADVP